MQIKYLQRFLWLYLAVMAVCCIYIFGIIVKASGDNVEHLNASWLIWQGYLPYKDFFQHHNPLLWYLSSPLVACLIDDISIFSYFNVISILAIYAMIYYQTKILLLNQTSSTAILFFAGIMLSSYSLQLCANYRPDTFMFLCLFAGLYKLFQYTEQRRLSLLVICFLCFFIGFMFTQKALMLLIIPGGTVLYWLCTKKIKLSDVLYASLLPLLLFITFLSYLYACDALVIYWKSNFLFNMYIPDIFFSHRIVFPPKEYIEFYIFLPLAGCASIYFLYKGSSIEKILSLMFILETVLCFFYFSTFLHYAVFWLILAVMLCVIFLDKLKRFEKPIAALGIIYLLFMCFYNYQNAYKTEIKSYHLLNGHEYAFKVLTPCDYAINGYYSVYNLKAKNPGYYSILLGQIDVLGEKIGIAPRDDLNELIRRYKPKIIDGGIYWDTYQEERGNKVIAHQINQSLLEKYYDYSGIGTMFILKPEYQKHNCLYNGNTWEFTD